MNASSYNDSSFKDFCTPLHDAIHLWLDDKENQQAIVARLSSEMGVLGDILLKGDYELSCVRIETECIPEVLIFNCNYNVGIVDAVLYSRYYCPHCCVWSDVRRTIIEIKPQLYSVSQILAQIKKYKHYLPRQQGTIQSELERSTGKPVHDTSSVLITLSDQTDAYDEMLFRSGIKVYRLSRDDLHLAGA